MISSLPSPVRQLPTLAALLLLAAACSGKKDKALPIATQPVQRRDIIIDAQATGVVEPINVVEVKSKASGQIVKMPVETGTLVKPGDLLVQIETRDVQNQYDQAAAALAAARSRLEVADAAKRRADELFKGRIITAAEHETAQLDYANAQSALVAARTNLDLNKQRLEDATVRAPVLGTIIDKTVSLGTVITSATGAFGGGTTLLKMADLGQVRIRALFNETDIGQVRPGQSATVTVTPDTGLPPEVLDSEFSPDDQLIGDCDIFGVKIRNAADGSLIRKIANFPIVSIAFSADGRFIAGASPDERAVKIWQVADGALVKTLEVSTDFEFPRVAYTPNGKLIVAIYGASDSAGAIQFWRARDGAPVGILSKPNLVHDIAFSPQPGVFAYTQYGGVVTVSFAPFIR